MLLPRRLSIPFPPLGAWGPGALLFFILGSLAYIFLPLNYHWEFIFRPAALELAAGRNPYSVPLFFNPPWVLLPLIPFALMPAKLGSAIISALTACVYGYVARRMGARPITALWFLLLPQNLYSLYNVNVEWLVALGFILPPRLGLFFVLAKPQAGALLALWWAVEAWRAGGWRAVVHLAWPVTAASVLCLALFGLPPGERYALVATAGVNFWPWAIPVGLVLLTAAIRRRQASLAIAAAPLLTPYSSLHVWPLALLGLLPARAEFVAGMAGLWVLWFVSPQAAFTDYLQTLVGGR